MTVNPGLPLARHRLGAATPARARCWPASTPTTTPSRSTPGATAASSAIGSLATGQLPAQIIAADLDGTGWDDLVVRNAGDGTLRSTSTTSRGSFWTGFDQPVPAAALTLPVGLGVSDVQAVDTTGDGRLDLVVTNKLTGQVSVLPQLAATTPSPPSIPIAPGPDCRRSIPAAHPRSPAWRRRRAWPAGPLTPGGPTEPGDDQPRLEHARRARGPGRRPLRQSRHHPDRRAPPRWSAWPTSTRRHRRPGRPHRRGREHLPRQRQGRLLVPGHLRRRRRSHRPDRRRRPGRRQARPAGRQRLWRRAGPRRQRRRHLPALRAGEGRPSPWPSPTSPATAPATSSSPTRRSTGSRSSTAPPARTPTARRSSATRPPACSPRAPSCWPT